jgi:hypothetical protein
MVFLPDDTTLKNDRRRISFRAGRPFPAERQFIATVAIVYHRFFTYPWAELCAPNTSSTYPAASIKGFGDLFDSHSDLNLFEGPT